MLPPSPDLPAILAQAQRGSRAAIDDLYNAYGAAVYRYCYVRLGDREDAQDCVQEVFECIWKGIGMLNIAGTLRLWHGCTRSSAMCSSAMPANINRPSTCRSHRNLICPMCALLTQHGLFVID